MSGEGALWVNGREAGAVSLDARDRGFTLGDGVFETIKVAAGVPLRWNLHAERLAQGLDVCGIPLPVTAATLRAQVEACIRAAGRETGVVRVSISRGVPAERGLLPGGEVQPSVVIEARPFAGYPGEMYGRGLRVAVSRIPRNERSPLAGVKSLSYLENVLARMEAHQAGADEAIVFNTGDRVAGASAANVFAVVAGELRTPPIADGALPGTLRRWVCENAARSCGLAAREQPLALADLASAEEVFLTNALMGVMPVVALDRAPVGGGQPGRVARLLRESLLQAEAAEAGTRAP